MLIGVCARDVRSQITLMPLMACSPTLRTHFRHLSDFAAVVVFLVLIVYVFLIAVAVMVVGFVLILLVAVAGDGGHGIDSCPSR